MHVVGKCDEKTAAQVDEICYIYAIMCGSYDDCLDTFGPLTAKEQGNEANDIGEGKHSFVAVHAFKYANEHQRSIILEHYGKNNADSVAAVKEVFRQIDLKSKCLKRRKLIAQRVNDKLAKIDDEALRNILKSIAKALHDWHF